LGFQGSYVRGPKKSRGTTRRGNGSERIQMSAIERDTEKIVTDLKRIVHDSEELLHSTKDAVGEKAEEVRKRLEGALKSAKRTCLRMEEKAIDGARAADKTIRRHPYESIGIAFATGLLLGVFMAKR
jgi:ElaB/YqjD/DUF883 family membrane-anchored ribosome-binding protein